MIEKNNIAKRNKQQTITVAVKQPSNAHQWSYNADMFLEKIELSDGQTNNKMKWTQKIQVREGNMQM